MSEVVPEKSRGLKFAEQQLLRHGWEHGKGLGRAENGISEAIKVKVKCDKGGVGHREGDQFTFHWWDHVFNKASSSLQVASDHDGIKLKKTEEGGGACGGMISNKKPQKASMERDKLYGCFVKSATLLSGQEQSEMKLSNSFNAHDDDDVSSSSSSDEEDERQLDLSSTTKLTDSELMKVCGGRTAHKGARHGLTMSAKLARLEQQEAEFMAKYGGRNQSGSTEPVSAVTQGCHKEVTKEEEAEPQQPVKKKKEKKKKKCAETEAQPKKNCKEESDETVCVENDSEKTKKKHKKKKRKVDDEGAESPAGQSEVKKKTMVPNKEVEEVKQKRKKCKKDKTSTHDEAPPPKKKKSRE